MIRNLTALTEETFDVLVVGGGIHGVLCAWDAVLRGLRVALIERGDFGSGTSQNSLKTIHGGLRYLKDGNLKRVRTMAAERRIWMKIAPHLVHPLTCVTPTYRSLAESRYAMTAALGLNDLLSYDRNSLPDPEKHLPDGYLISRHALARMIPGMDVAGITGGAVWYDAQVYNTERLLLSVVISSSQAGAVMVNYVEACKLLQTNSKVTGIQARDVFTGDVFDIQARVVINASGAWIDQLLGSLGQAESQQKFFPSVAINLVTRQVWSGFAAGLRSDPKKRAVTRDHSLPSQMFFIAPWRQYSLIGTWHLPWPYPADKFALTEEVLQEFIDELNTSHPSLKLSLEDVLHVHWGFLPVLEKDTRGKRVKLVREGLVLDHQHDHAIDGLISILGVKYTTARWIAQKAIDLALKKSGIQFQPCRTHLEPVWGGKIENFNAFLKKVVREAPFKLNLDIIQHLVYTYGSETTTILDYMQNESGLRTRISESSPVTQAEVVHAVRAEMAQKLVDIVQRRTELGSAGFPQNGALQACASVLADEMGLDESRIEKSLQEVGAAYPLKQLSGDLYIYAS
jgi:glycerol-3-phosphate dehydrogenase